MMTTPSKNDINLSLQLTSVTDEVDLIQYLLDTDQVNNHPQLIGLANKFVLEGLCYFVPSDID